jgi:predicted metalloprotease
MLTTIKRFGTALALTGTLLGVTGVFLGLVSSPAQALTPETNSVQTVVNTEYWDLVKLWKPILNYYGYSYYNPGVQYYDYNDSTGRIVDLQTGCGGTATRHGQEGFYCPTDHVIYLDYNQQVGNIRKYGDGAVAFWIDHEFGHHVQLLSGTKAAKPYYELNADCLAGMEFKYGVSYTGNLNGTSTSNDYTEARQNIWYGLFDSDTDHGTRSQRDSAFQYGYRNFDWKLCLNW